MKKSIIYIALMLLTAMGFTSCEGDQAMPPMVYPETSGDGSGANPYNVGGALAAIYSGNYTTKKVFVKGIVSQIEEFNASYGNITYYISDDGTTSQQLEVYRGLGLNGVKFASIDDLKVGDEVVIYCQLTYYNNSVAETNQGAILVSLNGSPYEAEEEPEPKGDGTGANPWNVTAALEIIYAENAPSNDVYVEGIVSQIDNIDTSYGNATYYISDSGSTLSQLEIYRGYSLDGKKFASTDELKVGDKVIVCGKVVLFNGTPEFTQGSKIVSLNGSEYEPDEPGGPTAEPKGDGSVGNPFNVSKTLEVITSGNLPGEKVYVEGIISSIKEVDTGSFGNASYYISDDGKTAGQFYIFRGYSLGNKKFTSADEIKVGDKVVVYGELINYQGNTPEMAQGNYIYSLNGKTEGGDTPTPDVPTGSEIYKGLVNNMDDWTIDNVTVPEGATYVWNWKEYNGSWYLNGSGYFNKAACDAEAYAYTTIDLTGYASVTATFDHAAKFQTTLRDLCGLVARVKGTTEWTKLSIPTWPQVDTWTFSNAGTIDLSAFAGKTVEVGFIYKSTTAGADTWEIKNFVVNGTK